jgi:serine protease Do
MEPSIMKRFRTSFLKGTLIGFFTLASILSAQNIMKMYADSGSYLGVGVAEINAEQAKALKLKEAGGVEITTVERDSPAEKAGLKKGDVVIEYNGHRVEGTAQFIRLVKETPVGRKVEIVVNRDGNIQTLTATIGSRKGAVFGPEFNLDRFRREMEELREFKMPDIPRPYMSWRSSMLGVEAESIEGQLAEYFGVKEGVLVRSVMKDSPAEKAGLKAGDVILKVDGETIATPRELSSAIRQARSKKTFPVVVMRDHKEMTLTVTMEGDRSEREQRREPKTIGDSGVKL